MIRLSKADAEYLANVCDRAAHARAWEVIGFEQSTSESEKEAHTRVEFRIEILFRIRGHQDHLAIAVDVPDEEIQVPHMRQEALGAWLQSQLLSIHEPMAV